MPVAETGLGLTAFLIVWTSFSSCSSLLFDVHTRAEILGRDLLLDGRTHNNIGHQELKDRQGAIRSREENRREEKGSHLRLVIRL